MDSQPKVDSLKRKANDDPPSTETLNKQLSAPSPSPAKSKHTKRQQKDGGQASSTTPPKKPKATARFRKATPLAHTVTAKNTVGSDTIDTSVIGSKAVVGEQPAMTDKNPMSKEPQDSPREGLPSSVSDSLAPPTDDADQEKAEIDLNELIPKAPPTDSVNRELPVKVQGWTENWPAPTETFPTEEPCPFNWDYIKDNTRGPLSEPQIQAYIMRAPWNPERYQRTFAGILKELNNAGDNSVRHEESVRKRFKTANTRVYETTGVYFEHNVLGVDKEYGLTARKHRPTTDELYKTDTQQDANAHDPQYALLMKEDSKQVPVPTYAFILKPPPESPNDRCVKCCDQGFCYDEGCTNDDCCDKGCCYEEWLCKNCSPRGEHQDSCRDVECGEIGCRCPCIHYPVVVSEGHTVERYERALEEKGAPFGCPDPAHQPLVVRDVVADRLDAVCHHKFEEVNLLRVEPKAFDLFTSCVVLDEQEGVPPRLLRLVRRDLEDPQEEMTYEPAGENDSLGVLLKAYCCSQALQCPTVSDILLNHLLITTKAEQKIADQRRLGRTIDDASIIRFSALDFEPEDINYVFRQTASNDPIRLLLLDIISDKGQDGRSKIQDKEPEYHPEFLKYWMAREFNEVVELLGERDSNAERADTAPSRDERDATHQDDRIADEERIAAILKLRDIDTFPRVIAEQKLRAEAESERRGLIGILEILYASPEEAGFVGNLVQTELQYQQYRDSFDGIISDNCVFRGWMPDPPLHLENDTEDSEQERDRRLSWNTSFLKDLDFNNASLCAIYHSYCTDEALCLRRPKTLVVKETPPRSQNSRRRRKVTALADVQEVRTET